MNIVLLYENMSDVPYANALRKVISSVYEDCKGIKSISFQHISQFDPHAENVYVFPVDLQWQDVTTIFESLSEKTLDKLSKYKIPIVFYLPTEGFSFKNEQFKDFMKILYDHRIDFNLFECPTFFITGNYKLQYEEVLGIDKTFYISYFEKKLYENLLDSHYDDILISELKKPKYDFLSYNGQIRPNRLAIFTKLNRKKLIGNGLISFLFAEQEGLQHEEKNLTDLLYPDDLKYFDIARWHWKPKYLDVSVGEYLDNAYFINNEHFLNSYFSLISETEYESDTCFPTEKIYKSIKALHPFVIWGSPGILNLLRKQGYETFPELFDESYDDEINHKKRLAMVVDQVEMFCSLPDKLKQRKRRSVADKLLHNRSTFNDNAQNFNENLKYIFLEIGKRINDKKCKT